ncbi:WXG100 family type VII secretion target [Paenibacillus xylanexedens]|uniref:WXG100 family type VII secretion target n=1 Tax=Paenibacillus xylanexedens TaxID=528191 RepID=UPI0016439B4C|nr:WXG100 family type VII secretion target [Paenibacillus xylanexedens]
MSTIKVTPEQLLHVSKQIEQGRQQLESIRDDLTARIGFIESQWSGATQERFFYDFQQSRPVLDRALESMVNSSQSLSTIAERFQQADQEQFSLGAITGLIAMKEMGFYTNHNADTPEYTMVYNTLYRRMMPTDKDGNVTPETLRAYERDTGSLEMKHAPDVEPEGEDIIQYQVNELKNGVYPFSGEPVSENRAKLLITSLQVSNVLMGFTGIYNRGYKVPKGGLKFSKSKHTELTEAKDTTSTNVVTGSTGGKWGAQDVYQYTQYKQSLLKKDVMSNSEVIIRGENLWDEKARNILTKDGSKIEDWAKMTSKQQYETPFGKGEIHFYQNQRTGELSEFDLKLKVSKPKKLRADEDDLFWIIDLDADFNLIGVR